MRLLIYQWNSYYQYDLYAICRDEGISFDIFEWNFVDKNHDENFEKWFETNIDISVYDAVFSVNYYPLLSNVCKKFNRKYIAWCYDNPLNVENIEATLPNINNYVFLFDKNQYEGYAKSGCDTVYYLPLGVNCKRYSKVTVNRDDIMKYGADVSFVGSLYASVFHQLIAPLSEYTRGYLNSLIDMQSQIYGFFTLSNAISQELVDDINKQYIQKEPNTKLKVSKEALVFAMASEVTRKDRLILLNMFGRRFKTKFYSYDTHEAINNVECCGPVDYVTQMPKVFSCSKININPSLRIIQTGIPQRALDIMGAGGFLLSNYQEELSEYFENGEEMILYDSIEDALEKAAFYIKNDDMRKTVALRGRRKVLSEFTMQKRINTIFNTVGI